MFNKIKAKGHYENIPMQYTEIFKVVKDIEDIYFFEVNTKYISSSE